MWIWSRAYHVTWYFYFNTHKKWYIWSQPASRPRGIPVFLHQTEDLGMYHNTPANQPSPEPAEQHRQPPSSSNSSQYQLAPSMSPEILEWGREIRWISLSYGQTCMIWSRLSGDIVTEMALGHSSSGITMQSVLPQPVPAITTLSHPEIDANAASSWRSRGTICPWVTV